MTDRLAELEGKVAELGETVRALETRLAAVERGRGRASPAARRAAPGSAPLPGVPPLSATVTWVGRTLLVLAGAFVLRALTDSGTLPAPLGVALGLAYAGTWVALAERAGRTGAKWSAGFHGASAVLIGFPLLFEAASRFRLLPPAAAAALLAALTAVALGVAARRRLEGLAWLVSLAAAVTAFALALVTNHATPPALVVVALAVATLWLGYVLDWRGIRWFIALAADLLVALVALRAVSSRAVEGPGAAFLVESVLVALFLGSVAIRTLVLGRNVVLFEVVQTAAAIVVGLGGAALVASRSGAGAGAFGAVSLAVGLAAYGVAFAFVERHKERSANFLFYTSAAILLVLSGTALFLPGVALPLAWAAFAVLAAALARRHGRLTLAAHGAAYAVAAAAASGLLSHAAIAAFASPGEGWPAAGPASVAVLAAMVATTWLAAGATARTRPAERIPQLLLLAVVACGAAGLAVGWLAPLLAGGAAETSAGTVATLRTGVWVAGALLLAWLGRRPGWVEAGWLAWPALAATGLKILAEDLPRSRPATLFLAFALYGAALIVVARARRRPRGAGAQV